MAKLASPDAVGRFALGTAVTAPIFLFAGLNLNAVQVTDTERRFAFSDYLGVRLAGMLAALVAVAVIVSLSPYDRQMRLVALAVGMTKAIEGVSDIHYGFLQQNERMRPMAASLMWRGTLGVLAVCSVLWAGGGLLLAVVAMGASWLAVLVAHDWRAVASLMRATARHPLQRPRWRTFRHIAATSAPIAVVLMLVSLRTNLPRYFIENQLGASELGVYAAVSSLVAAGNLVIAALGQAATPRLAHHYFAVKLRAFRRLMAQLLLVAGFVGCAGVALAIFAGKPLLRVLFGPVYAGRADVLVWLMVAGLIAYADSFLGCALTAARRFKIQLPLFAVTAVACAGASAWLVPRYGLIGAAWAWGATLMLESIAAAVILALAVRARSGQP